MNKQIIDEKEIKCNSCNNNKFLYGNNFYICTCQNKICQLCINKHEKSYNHNLIYYNKRYTICNKHIIEFISYCPICNLNLCEKCEKDHESHKNKIKIFKKEIPNEKKINEIKKEIDLIISNIEQFKIEIDYLKELFNFIIINLTDEIDNYIKLYKKISLLLNNLKNYQNIKNILNYKNINLYKEINNFLNENIKNKIGYLLKEKKFEISLTYKYYGQYRIKLFDKKFVENNKDNLILSINNKIMNICEYYYINKETNDRTIKVKLIQKNKITNMSYMFYECDYLLSLTKISNFNTNNVKDMSYMFYNCSRLSSLHDISKLNTNNVHNMGYMFYNCNKLTSLPDLSKWNTNNVNNMSFMFYGCRSLSSLPDLSK